jgi:hypothetical protein
MKTERRKEKKHQVFLLLGAHRAGATRLRRASGRAPQQQGPWSQWSRWSRGCRGFHLRSRHSLRLAGQHDITVGEYVRCVSSYNEAVQHARGRRPKTRPTALLVDPDVVIDASITALSGLRPSLLGKTGDRSFDVEQHLKKVRTDLTQALGLNGSDA